MANTYQGKANVLVVLPVLNEYTKLSAYDL
jgi:hypothetical protein